MGWNENIMTGRDAFDKGSYEEAERFFSSALTEAQKLGMTDPRLAQSLNDLGMLYHSLGRLTEAEPLYRKAIAIDEKRGDDAWVDIAITLENLAELYKTQQRIGEAAAMYRRAVALIEKLYKDAVDKLGKAHPDVVPYSEVAGVPGRGPGQDRRRRKSLPHRTENPGTLPGPDQRGDCEHARPACLRADHSRQI